LSEETLIVDNVHPQYRSSGMTHPGLARATNQDAFVDRPVARLWAVADGMGGHRDGDVASRMVCASLAAFEPGHTLEDSIDDVRQRMSEVNQRLFAASIRPVNPVQSGTTVVMLLVRHASCAVLWAGDSRVYRLRDRQLTQMSRDHTWAAQLNLPESAEEVDHSIMRAVGGEDVLLLDVVRDRVREGDRYLLCSDGLTREVTTPQIAELLGKGDPRSAAAALIQATLTAGARDNVTVIVVDAMQPAIFGDTVLAAAPRAGS
jgi:serine/threonine protein phosphatase PrpC